MNKRQFAVIGLGRFGMSVAMTLAQAGYEVIAVDSDEERVQEIADHVTYCRRSGNQCVSGYSCKRGRSAICIGEGAGSVVW